MEGLKPIVLVFLGCIVLAASQDCCGSDLAVNIADIIAKGKEIVDQITAECPLPTEAPEVPPDFTPSQGPGFDCPGDDLENVDIDQEACTELCRNDDACVGFVWSTNPEATAPCMTKQVILCENPVPLENTGAFRKFTPEEEEAATEMQVTPALYERIATNVWCKANILLHENIAFDACGRKCTRYPQCVGFIYSLSDQARTMCMLREIDICIDPEPLDNSVVYRKLEYDSDAEEYVRDESDYVPPDTAEDIQVTPADFIPEVSDFDCPGNNLRAENVDFDSCANKCKTNAGCIGFVFSINPVAVVTCALKQIEMCETTVPQDDTVVYRLDAEVVPELQTVDDLIAAGDDVNFGSELDGEVTTEVEPAGETEVDSATPTQGPSTFDEIEDPSLTR